MLKGLGGGGQEQRLGESGGFAFRSPKPLKGTQCDNGVFSDFWVLFPCSGPTLPQNDQMAIKSEYLDQIWKWGSSQLLGSSSDKVLEEIGQERIPKGQVDVTGQNGAQIINKKTETEGCVRPTDTLANTTREVQGGLVPAPTQQTHRKWPHGSATWGAPARHFLPLLPLYKVRAHSKPDAFDPWTHSDCVTWHS